jgi:hypothetical protein
MVPGHEGWGDQASHQLRRHEGVAMHPRVLWSAPEPEAWQAHLKVQDERDRQEQQAIDWIAWSIIGVALLVAWWAQ